MHLYQILAIFLPDKLAKLLTIVIMSALLVAVIFCGFESQLSFKYGNL